jgi:hypothetical protein
MVSPKHSQPYTRIQSPDNQITNSSETSRMTMLCVLSEYALVDTIETGGTENGSSGQPAAGSKITEGGFSAIFSHSQQNLGVAGEVADAESFVAVLTGASSDLLDRLIALDAHPGLLSSLSRSNSVGANQYVSNRFLAQEAAKGISVVLKGVEAMVAAADVIAEAVFAHVDHPQVIAHAHAGVPLLLADAPFALCARSGLHVRHAGAKSSDRDRLVIDGLLLPNGIRSLVRVLSMLPSPLAHSSAKNGSRGRAPPPEALDLAALDATATKHSPKSEHSTSLSSSTIALPIMGKMALKNPFSFGPSRRERRRERKRRRRLKANAQNVSQVDPQAEIKRSKVADVQPKGGANALPNMNRGSNFSLTCYSPLQLEDWDIAVSTELVAAMTKAAAGKPSPVVYAPTARQLHGSLAAYSVPPALSKTAQISSPRPILDETPTKRPRPKRSGSKTPINNPALDIVPDLSPRALYPDVELQVELRGDECSWRISNLAAIDLATAKQAADLAWIDTKV